MTEKQIDKAFDEKQKIYLVQITQDSFAIAEVNPTDREGNCYYFTFKILETDIPNPIEFGHFSMQISSMKNGNIVYTSQPDFSKNWFYRNKTEACMAVFLYG